MNLNIRYDLPKEIWEQVIPEIFREAEGWLGYQEEIPHWFSFREEEKYVSASLEPNGLFFYGLMEDDEWESWKLQFKQVATARLKFPVGEIELGEV